MDETGLATIFQPFVRDENGAGLCLAIAAKAMRLHGGTIHATNRPGGGLVVTCNHSAGVGLDGTGVTAPESDPAAPGR